MSSGSNSAELVPVDGRAAVERLQAEMAKMPQVEHFVMQHHRADGMYCRVLEQGAEVLIVGKVHRREHFFMVVKGRIAVTTDEGVKEVIAPAVLVSSPGTKRAIFALEDSVYLTVHRTELPVSASLDELEAELVEEDKTALFDARNELKRLELPCLS